MTDAATQTSAPTTPEGQLAYFRERRELAVTQPQGSLALTTRSGCDPPQTDLGRARHLGAARAGTVGPEGDRDSRGRHPGRWRARRRRGHRARQGRPEPLSRSCSATPDAASSSSARTARTRCASGTPSRRRSRTSAASTPSPTTPTGSSRPHSRENPAGTTVGFEHPKDEERAKGLPGRSRSPRRRRLRPRRFKSGRALQLVFADATNGDSTYSVGRFLFVAPTPTARSRSTSTAPCCRPARSATPSTARSRRRRTASPCRSRPARRTCSPRTARCCTDAVARAPARPRAWSLPALSACGPDALGDQPSRRARRSRSTPSVGCGRATDLDDSGPALGTTEVVHAELGAVGAREGARAPALGLGRHPALVPAPPRGGVRVERCLDLRLCPPLLRSRRGDGRPPRRTAARRPVGRAPAARARPPTRCSTSSAGSDADPVARVPAPAGRDRRSPRPRAALAARSPPSRRSAGRRRDAASPACRGGRDVHDALLTELLGPRPAAGRPARMEARSPRSAPRSTRPTSTPTRRPSCCGPAARRAAASTSTRSWELRGSSTPASSRCSSTRSSRGCSSPTAGPGSTRGCATAGSGPTTCPAASSPAGGRRAAAERCSCRGQSAAPSSPTPAGSSSSPTPRSSSRASSPRLSGDRAMAAPGAGDLYEGIVATGAVETRPRRRSACSARCTAARPGESGRHAPALARAFPPRWPSSRAAARAGEQGEVVTHLARPHLAARRRRRARRAARRMPPRRPPQRARAWGRFTRNFVVQGTAAEWALCWMGSLRRRLWELGGDGADAAHRAPAPRVLPARRGRRPRAGRQADAVAAARARPPRRPAGCCSATPRCASRLGRRRRRLREAK